MATASSSHSLTETVVQQPPTSPTLRLRLEKPKDKKEVKWRQGTVDNEHLNKKKSKCCCIYEKNRMFGESSSEDEDDNTGHCHGHKRGCYNADKGRDAEPSPGGGPDVPGPSAT